MGAMREVSSTRFSLTAVLAPAADRRHPQTVSGMPNNTAWLDVGGLEAAQYQLEIKASLKAASKFP